MFKASLPSLHLPGSWSIPGNKLSWYVSKLANLDNEIEFVFHSFHMYILFGVLKIFLRTDNKLSRCKNFLGFAFVAESVYSSINIL